eukprot:scaffold74642_cov48-Prasinocladus_malaysianus.AAC.1
MVSSWDCHIVAIVLRPLADRLYSANSHHPRGHLVSNRDTTGWIITPPEFLEKLALYMSAIFLTI